MDEIGIMDYASSETSCCLKGSLKYSEFTYSMTILYSVAYTAKCRLLQGMNSAYRSGVGSFSPISSQFRSLEQSRNGQQCGWSTPPQNYFETSCSHRGDVISTSMSLLVVYTVPTLLILLHKSDYGSFTPGTTGFVQHLSSCHTVSYSAGLLAGGPNVFRMYRKVISLNCLRSVASCRIFSSQHQLTLDPTGSSELQVPRSFSASFMTFEASRIQKL
uniref:Uncharacterized protein n=1 Tax=Setaria digitata TaxID=48799 RepID=A0A915Q202_9BILA